MNKMGFNERYGLQQAVFDRTKWKTRRLEKGLEDLKEGFFSFAGKKEVHVYGEKGTLIETIKPRYQIGEVVAVAQAYKDVIDVLPDRMRELVIGFYSNSKAWTNKMFVRADLMPRHIRITDVDLQRLQSISDEDCMKEGILSKYHAPAMRDFYYIPPTTEVTRKEDVYWSPKEAFAALIDKISGKRHLGTQPVGVCLFV